MRHIRLQFASHLDELNGYFLEAALDVWNQTNDVDAFRCFALGA